METKNTAHIDLELFSEGSPTSEKKKKKKKVKPILTSLGVLPAHLVCRKLQSSESHCLG